MSNSIEHRLSSLEFGVFDHAGAPRSHFETKAGDHGKQSTWWSRVTA